MRVCPHRFWTPAAAAPMIRVRRTACDLVVVAVHNTGPAPRRQGRASGRQDMNLQTSHLVFLVASLVYIGIRIHFQRQVAREAKAQDHSSRSDRLLVLLVVLAQGGLPLLLIFTPLLNAASYTLPQAALWPGAALMLAGLLLFWRAHADLGRNWSVTLELAEQHRLVTHGVYRHIRHPMYAAFYVLALGQLLLLHNAIAGGAALLAVSVMYLVRKPHEEGMMIQAFGDDYRAYMARTGGVLPRLFARRSA